LPPRIPKDQITLEASYEYVVVGAGYTGLAVARRLAELNSSATILLLEATQIGEGTSGRNSGFVLTAPLTAAETDAQAVKKATRQFEIFDGGLAWLRQIVSDASIECGWNDVGKYHAAATDEGVANIRALAERYQACGLRWDEIPQAEFARRIGSPYYKYAFHTGHNVFVQPAALVRGLADSLPPNVILLEGAPVSSVSGKGPFTIELLNRRVRANKMVIANNGFAKRLGFLKNRIFNVYTYAGITPELDDDELAAHGTDAEWGILPAARAGTTLRRTSGRRFLVRSLQSYETDRSGRQVDESLEELYRQRYPGLRSHKFEYVWGGALGLTMNSESCFGEIAENLYVSAGCNGVGIMKGTVHGKLLAEQIMGLDSDDIRDVRQMNAPTWIPPDPVLRWGVTLAMTQRTKHAGAER
jgi:glycine/D-amino acid oxidase-like deaminating enzyme